MILDINVRRYFDQIRDLICRGRLYCVLCPWGMFVHATTHVLSFSMHRTCMVQMSDSVLSVENIFSYCQCRSAVTDLTNII